MYSKLLATFSSRDHLIIGRDSEERQIKKHLQTNMDKNQSSMLYVCGHPGQGKSAVMD
jgi:Cdc6-like AAA superfamily ATPase